jgi:hypothetical protein
MKQITMSAGAHEAAGSLQLMEFSNRRKAVASAVTRIRADWRVPWVVTATILLCALNPGRSEASALSGRAVEPNQAIGGRNVAASLTQSPLVMRMSKDEFRIAFGIKSVGCTANGCRGAIRYRVSWKAADGTTRRETRQVDYTVAPHSAARTIAVDRQYFDTAEGAHTTDVIVVTVDRITCYESTESAVLAGNGPDKVSAEAGGNLVSRLAESSPPAASN